jgi:hypothetical protein
MLQAGMLWVQISMTSLNFSIDLILPATLGPGVDSASIRNEYQKQKKCFWRVERGQCVRLTVLPPSIFALMPNRSGSSGELLERFKHLFHQCKNG